MDVNKTLNLPPDVKKIFLMLNTFEERIQLAEYIEKIEAFIQANSKVFPMVASHENGASMIFLLIYARRNLFNGRETSWETAADLTEQMLKPMDAKQIQ